MADIILSKEDVAGMIDRGEINPEDYKQSDKPAPKAEEKADLDDDTPIEKPTPEPKKEKKVKAAAAPAKVADPVTELPDPTVVENEDVVTGDADKPFWEKDPEPAKVDFEKELKATKAELELAKKSIDSDPVLKAWLKAKKEGKDPVQAVKNLLLQDPSNISDDELIAADLMQEEKLSKEEAIERVEGMDAYLKKRLAKPLKDALISQHQSQFKEFGFNDYLESQKVPEELETFANDLTSQIEGGTGKKLFNILTQDEKVTKTMLSNLSKSDCFSPTDENGKFDADTAKLIMIVKDKNLRKQFLGEIAKTYQDKGMREGLATTKADRPIVSGGQGLAASKTSADDMIKSSETVYTVSNK